MFFYVIKLLKLKEVNRPILSLCKVDFDNSRKKIKKYSKVKNVSILNKKRGLATNS